MRVWMKTALWVALLAACCGFTECYRTAGRGDALPRHIRTLAIPTFQNPSLRFRVEQRFTAAVIDEALRRARPLRIVSTAEGADAVMIGSIKNFFLRPVVLDNFGRARVFEITVVAALTLRDQTVNKVIYDNQYYVFRAEYEVSGDPATFFSEEGPAVERLARDFARSIISTIWEGF